MRFQVINDRKRQLGLTNAAIAEKTGITLSTLDKITSGANQNPTLDTLQKIADVIGVNLDDFRDDYVPSRVGSRFSDASVSYSGPRPDLDKAATVAAQVMIAHHVTAAPVDPLRMLKAMPEVFVVTFTEMAGDDSLALDGVPSHYGAVSQDAASYSISGGRLHVVAYNQRMPFYMVQTALARELGHIVLGHTDAQAEELRTAEALIFARHLLCPRPLIRALLECGVSLTVEEIGNLTGCYGRELSSIRKIGGARVPARLNKQIRSQLAVYVDNYMEYRVALLHGDESTPADFGTYMDYYEE